jgi:signal transduction histidine kinase
VVGPLVGLTLKMEQLAFGKRDIEIELTDRADEVGGLARATLVFRDALVETDRLRIEQAIAQQAAEAAKLEVQAANLQLEARVAERTKQLLATQDNLITKERLADEARKIAEEASRAKSDFLAMMSHELRTPLNAVIGYSELLLDETEGTEFQHHRNDLNHINSAGKHLLTLVSDILDLSKLEIGKIELETSDFDLVALIVESVALLEPKARDKGIELSVKIDPAARRRFHGDPTRLRQILFNLVDNAIKFTERGAVSIEVASRAGEPPWLRFEVSDTGIGVADDVRQKLFQKFGQADSSITRRFGGTGLGLAISKQLLDLMGGRIGVERAPDHGSLFWFEVSLPPATSLSREQDCGITSALKNAPSAA